MEADKIYPTILPEKELQEQYVAKLNEKENVANQYRINTIKEFIKELKQDYVKYNNKKNKYCMIKNILMFIDISIGSILTIGGLILEAGSFGASTIPSLILSGAGIGMVMTLPVTNKLSDKLSSKNRNFEIFAKQHLNEVKMIFSKAMNDNYISHEELELVILSKKKYEEAKHKLKTKNKKELEKIFNDHKENVKIEKYTKIAERDAKNEIKKELKRDMQEKMKSL